MVNGKQKGGEWERQVCKLLSLWVSAGEHKDLFWRSAMSGGRATVARGAVRQAGDICAVAPEGHSLTDRYYIECKIYKDLNLARFFIEQKGQLAAFWHETIKQAAIYNRSPMLVAKQNLYPAIVVTKSFRVRRRLHYESVVVDTDSMSAHVVRFDYLLQSPYREF